MKNDIKYCLQPATNDDIDFLFQLRLKTMKPFFENTIGWNDAEEFEKVCEELIHAKIVMFGKEKIGTIKVLPEANELHLNQIQIEPKFQKNGLGAELLRETIFQSESLQKPITLFVIKKSPAKRLYDRFNFEVTEDYEYYCKMLRRPQGNILNDL